MQIFRKYVSNKLKKVAKNDRFRLSISRSIKNISAQIIDDSKNIIIHGKLKLDPSQLECEWDGKQLPDKLTTTEFLLVKELAK